MPYRYRKRNYKRKRNLTKASILANRSARSQSKQIAKLNSKVNYLTRQNKPEILTRFVSLARSFTNSALASNYEVYFWNPWTTIYAGSKDYSDSLNGDFCRCKSINVRFNVEYSDSWSGNVSQSENHQRTASYRIVIAQLRKTLPSAISSSDVFDQLFHTTSSISSGDENTILPLKSGVSSIYNILYAKSYGISNQHPIHLRNINLRKHLTNFRNETNSSGSIQFSGTSQGTVIVAILTGGLHSDANYNSEINVKTMIKLAFTDS